MTEASTSTIKRYRPYFHPAEVERLSAKQRGKLSVSREERARQQACALIDAVGMRCGFPRRTIATAQTLYLRFHLFFPYADFHYVEVALTTLYVASKLHDTLKKPRDIILASYALRFPHLVRKGGAGGGHVDMTAVDTQMLEHERRRVLNIERLVLETVCFSFGVAVPFPLVVKFGKTFGLGKEAVQSAWRVAVDAHRTPAPLSYPPHAIALGSMYASALLSSGTTKPHEGKVDDPEGKRVIALLGSEGPWEKDYSVSVGDVDEVAHAILDLYITILSTPANDPSLQIFSPSPVSPREQAPSPGISAPAAAPTTNTAFKLPRPWTVQSLTELKIHLRERRPGAAPSWEELEDDAADADAEGMGRNDITVRFVWYSPA
ncbi:RNA polymerase II C-terminal domain kinase beta subunit [Vanrija albida]|uniref:RNA polymerase II C-terminal domain kinase beta subunit n=1 Tax=Vanrija albida TaxID=181172 RepID=A0ABR3Q6G3_9TREE